MLRNKANHFIDWNLEICLVENRESWQTIQTKVNVDPGEPKEQLDFLHSPELKAREDSGIAIKVDRFQPVVFATGENGCFIPYFILPWIYPPKKEQTSLLSITHHRSIAIIVDHP